MLQIEYRNKRMNTTRIDRVVIKETIKADAYMPIIRYDEDNDGIVDVAMRIGNTREEDIVKKDDVIDCGTF